ncbi:F-box protein [Quillaja saponaria]|uniref:F-box protein n=1 Tax=Quillaja saponaria TaxID=32244 RepID=A0AAD7PVN5_QUISA|nr:F-box protein [Quillaja saponaria]
MENTKVMQKLFILNHQIILGSVSRFWGHVMGCYVLLWEVKIFTYGIRSQENTRSHHPLSTCRPEPLGFGYDHFTDDYKIVHYPQPRYIFSGLPPAKTYSLRTDCWISRIDEEVLNPYSGVIHLCEPEAGTLVNNALYWHAAYKHRNLKTFDDSCVICPHDDEEFGKTEDACSVIFRFSLVDEKELLLLPPPAIEFAGVFELIDFKGCLCISELDSDRYYINMWVLMEDDVNAATKFNWMKLMRIPCLDTMLAPIYFMRNGEVLLNVREHSADSLCNGFRQCRFYSYNPTEETVTEVRVQCIKDWSSEIKYSETQVSLH